jgi:protein CpxP
MNRLSKTLAQPLMAVTLLVALAGATATLAQAQPMPGHAASAAGEHGPRHAGMHRMAPGGMMGPMLPERLLDEVGASPEQKTKVRDIFKAAQADMAKQHEAGRELHRQMAQAMAAPQVDAAAVEALRQKQLAQHDAHSKRMVSAMLEAGAVLTPEQRQKLAQRLKTRQDMMERHHRERQSMDTPRG